METNALIQTIAEMKARDCFVSGYKAPQERKEAEALGIAISQWAQWDGLKIMRVFHAALEDSNFHREAGVVDGMIKYNETK